MTDNVSLEQTKYNLSELSHLRNSSKNFVLGNTNTTFRDLNILEMILN